MTPSWSVPLLLAAVALSAAGCQRKADVELTPAEMEHLKLERYDPNHGRAVQPLVSEFGTEEGAAEVVAVDPVALTVALRHRQESHDDWPGMVMNFRIRRSLVGLLKPGERIYFKATVLDQAGEIVEFSSAPRE